MGFLPQQRPIAVVAMRNDFGGQVLDDIDYGQGVKGLAARAVQVHRCPVQLAQKLAALPAVCDVFAVDLEHMSPQQPRRVNYASPADG